MPASEKWWDGETVAVVTGGDGIFFRGPSLDINALPVLPLMWKHKY